MRSHKVTRSSLSWYFSKPAFNGFFHRFVEDQWIIRSLEDLFENCLFWKTGLQFYIFSFFLFIVTWYIHLSFVVVTWNIFLGMSQLSSFGIASSRSRRRQRCDAGMRQESRQDLRHPCQGDQEHPSGGGEGDTASAQLDLCLLKFETSG